MLRLPLRIQGGVLRNRSHGLARLVRVTSAIWVGGPDGETVVRLSWTGCDKRSGFSLILTVQLYLDVAGDGNVDAVAVEFAADGHVLGDNLSFNVLGRVHIGFWGENHGRGCASSADVAVILSVLGFGVGQIVNNTLVRPLGVFGVIDTFHVQLGQSDIVRAFGVNVHDETGIVSQRGGHTITLQFLRVNVEVGDITVGVDVTLVHVGEIMGRVGFRSFRPLGG